MTVTDPGRRDTFKFIMVAVISQVISLLFATTYYIHVRDMPWATYCHDAYLLSASNCCMFK